MTDLHPHIGTLLRAISLEEQAQTNRFRLSDQQSIKTLKKEGLALHPISVVRRQFGYAEYPEISFRLPFPADTNLFRDGAAIECFYQNEEPVKGVLLQLEGRQGEFRLFAPDFPDWIEEDGVGIKLATDHHTTDVMKTVMKGLLQKPFERKLFSWFHDGIAPDAEPENLDAQEVSRQLPHLNESQQQAVNAILRNALLTIVHGPPGTGKTTTLTEAVLLLAQAGKKTVVAAPSNAAVDHFALGLIRRGVPVLRVGNTARVHEEVFPFTPEGRLAGPQQKEIRQLKLRAEEFRRMALKYKRNFGKAEREQRNLLFREVKEIRNQIKRLREYNEQKLFDDAMVVLGTPVALHDSGFEPFRFHTLIIDEAGQCIEPLAWSIIPLAPRLVLAGDHWQLPPTVISEEAAVLGLNRSILEVAVDSVQHTYLLNTQFRMREAIAGFSSSYFYDGLLLTAAHLVNTGVHLTFIDTAGAGFEEAEGREGVSLQNEGELSVVQKLLEAGHSAYGEIAVITPYSGQAFLAKESLPGIRISTIDSFQGQETDTVFLSLVRSNDTGEIGFLKDYRRMNVAVTRARENLFVIGDSATIGSDPFYASFLKYVESKGAYRSVWELDLL